MEGEENRMEKLILAVSLICLLASAVIMALVRKRLLQYSRQMGECLDAMIAGRKEIVFQEEEDTLTGKLQSKLHRLCESLDQKSQENEIQRRQLETMVADISHQVKTPIANVRMYHSLLEKKNLDEEKRQQFLAAAERQTDKLEFLMKSMIKVSRLENGIVKVQPKENSIRQLLEQAVCDVALKADEKQIHIEMACEDSLKAVFDGKWTLEAVFNILDNAVKYTGVGGNIRIQAQVTDFYVRIGIEDDGKGIEESRITEIFKRFYREPEVADQDGVGVGLYLAREIVMKERGFIEVRSKAGKGTKFYVNLPVVQ